MMPDLPCSMNDNPKKRGSVFILLTINPFKTINQYNAVFVNKESMYLLNSGRLSGSVSMQGCYIVSYIDRALTIMILASDYTTYNILVGLLATYLLNNSPYTATSC